MKNWTSGEDLYTNSVSIWTRERGRSHSGSMGIALIVLDFSRVDHNQQSLWLFLPCLEDWDECTDREAERPTDSDSRSCCRFFCPSPRSDCIAALKQERTISLDVGDLSLLELQTSDFSRGWSETDLVCLVLSKATLSKCLLSSPWSSKHPLSPAPKEVLWTTVQTTNIDNRLDHMTKLLNTNQAQARQR